MKWIWFLKFNQTHGMFLMKADKNNHLNGISFIIRLPEQINIRNTYKFDFCNKAKNGWYYAFTPSYSTKKDKLAQIHLIQAQEFFYGYDNESVICKKN